MRFTRLIGDDTYKPKATPSLLTREGLLFGSGNAGAGGKLLLSLRGHPIVKGVVPLYPIDGDNFEATFTAAQCFKSQARTDAIWYTADAIGIEPGQWVDGTDPYIPTAYTELYAHARTTATANAQNTAFYYSVEKQREIWQTLKDHANQTLASLPDTTPPAPTAIEASVNGSGSYVRTMTPEATQDTALRLLANFSTSDLNRVAYTIQRRRTLGLQYLAYYGRRDSVPTLPLVINGTIKDAIANITIYEATGDPATYLKDTADAAPMPFWNPVHTFAVTQADAPALKSEDGLRIPCPLRGSTLHLAVWGVTPTQPLSEYENTTGAPPWEYSRSQEASASFRIGILNRHSLAG